MRIVMFGAGGVGGYFGGRLAEAGLDVTFIARGQHLAAMNKEGLRITSLQGDFSLPSVQATDNPADLGVVDTVIVAVKAWQVPDVAEAMRPLVGPDTVIVPLQNGVESPTQLADVLGESRVLGGFCRIVSYMTAPGHIQHAGGDPYMAFGEMDNQPSERVKILLELLSQVKGMTVEIPEDIQAAMWGKFLQISSWSGMGAVTRAPAGVWRSIPETRDMWQAAMREVLDVAQAHNIALSGDLIRNVTAYVDNLPSQATASMQRDIMEGRPSELSAQSGAVVRLGEELGVPTPTHAFIYNSLLPAEMKARGEIEFP